LPTRHRKIPPERRQLSGPELRDARRWFGMNQDELARRWGVSRVTISAWENGSPPTWTADAVASWFPLELPRREHKKKGAGA
jgi:DNA-binding XRE family transcriptional regulator